MNSEYKAGGGGPLPLPSKMSNSLFIVRFSWDLKHNIFICLPIIIDIEINVYEPPYPPWGLSTLSLPPPLKIVKFFIYGAILLKFETE